MGNLDDVFGISLIESDFERMGDRAMYRGSIGSQHSPGQQHNVFVSFQDDASPELMSPIGLTEQLRENDIESSREPDDGCGVTVIASYAALTIPLDLNRMVKNPSTIVEDAIAHASYADSVQAKLTQRVAEKNRLLNTIQAWLTETSTISSGQITVEQFLVTADDLLNIIPEPGLLAQLHDVAVRTSITDWAHSESGDSLGSGAWSQISDGLDTLRLNRGWPEVTEAS